MLAVVLTYIGLILAAFAVVCLIRPIARIGLPTRRRALLLLTAAFALALTGMLFPAPEIRVAVAQSQLDIFLPEYQFSEFHSTVVEASPAEAYRALSEVTAGEIALFRTLTWIRRGGQPGPESVLNAPEDQPILDVVTRTGFLRLAEKPGHEVVVGTLIATPPGWKPDGSLSPDGFNALRRPGFTLAAMSFCVESAGPGRSRVTTETRILAGDPASRRRFGAYWRVIYPGSALIRRSWLRAIAQRAERQKDNGPAKAADPLEEPVAVTASCPQPPPYR